MTDLTLTIGTNDLNFFGVDTGQQDTISKTTSNDEKRRILDYLGLSILDSNIHGTLSGSVIESGILLPNAIVLLYHRESGQLVDMVRSDSLGNFVFRNLNTTPDLYFIVARTTGGFNNIGYDKLTAI